MSKCDVCEVENENVIAGRWIFYCPKHKYIDYEKTMENEMPNGFTDDNIEYALGNGELSEMLSQNL